MTRAIAKGATTTGFIVCLLLAGCVSPSVKREILSAVGPSLQDAPVLKSVKPETPAVGKLQAGDKVVAIDGQPINSITQLADALLDETHQAFTIARGPERVDFPIDVLADRQSKSFNVLLLNNDETFTFDANSVTGPTMRAAMVGAGRLSGQVSTSVWKSQPSLIEVELKLYVPNDCNDCELRNVAVMDLSRRAWLSLVRFTDAAFAVVPEIGQAGTPIPVPPPTVVGATSTTTVQGTVAASTYGNQTTGTYSGSAYTTTTPVYDYSNQYAAMGHNLGVAIRNSQIETANKERINFVNMRLGNLRSGQLNPGEIVTGHLFFAAPVGFEGPYAVFVDAGENAVGFSQFSRSSK